VQTCALPILPCPSLNALTHKHTYTNTNRASNLPLTRASCRYTLAHKGTQALTHTHTHTHTHKQTHINNKAHTRTHTHTHTHEQTNTHKQPSTGTHTHTQTHVQNTNKHLHKFLFYARMNETD